MFLRQVPAFDGQSHTGGETDNRGKDRQREAGKGEKREREPERGNNQQQSARASQDVENQTISV